MANGNYPNEDLKVDSGCVCAHTRTHAHTHTHTSVRISMFTYVCLFVCKMFGVHPWSTDISVSLSISLSFATHTHAHTHMCVCVGVCVCGCGCKYIYLYIYIYLKVDGESPGLHGFLALSSPALWSRDPNPLSPTTPFVLAPLSTDKGSRAVDAHSRTGVYVCVCIYVNMYIYITS
jgi:hypothetical protein